MPLSIVSRLSPIRPAITTVCPSRITVRVVASRVEITGALSADWIVCVVSVLTSCRIWTLT
jgi:hypothetical protein